jgi:alpha-tubulin suppressor-like RCC1 family protein
MTRRYLWLFIGALSLGLGCPTERPTEGSKTSDSTVIQIDEGPLTGASMKVPAGAYTGTEPLTMAAGSDIPLDDMGEPGDEVTAVGPALELGPDGTQFAEPMTISLPFSSQAYNDGDMEDTQIAVVGRHAGGSIIKIDVGPVFMESVVAPNKPIEIDVGPVFLVANEGNEVNDALLVFQVTEFSSYQVVRVSKSDWVCDRWEQVAAGDHHTCGLFDIGTKTELYCWGNNASHTLGNNHEEKATRNAPKVAVEENDNKDWRSVAAGGSHTCAIDSEKDLYCWGSDSHGQLGSDQVTTYNWVHPNHVGKWQDLKWKSVSLGWYHTCAIDKDKQLWCWGGNDHGQLGMGYVGAEHNTGKPMEVNADSVPLEWVSVEAGAEHTCALTKEDAVYCWGHNNKGQVDSAEETIGLGKPQRMVTASADQFKSVTAGLEHTCAITSGKCDSVMDPCDPEGTLYCWGENGWGQLGINEEEGQWPMTKVRGEQQWREVEAGSYHTCALGDGEDNKGLWCWGNNGSGQLLADDPNLAKAIQPVSVVQHTQWVQFSMGRDHSCGLVGDGNRSRLFCAGSNANGQLGDLDANDPSHEPVSVCVSRDGVCLPNCSGTTCGPDGCGGQCSCKQGWNCVLGVCNEDPDKADKSGTEECSSDDDMALLDQGESLGFLGFLGECVALECGVSGLDSDEACVKECLEFFEYSEGCAGCFGTFVGCAYEHCGSSCTMEPALASWTCDWDCVSTAGCFEALSDCTGLCKDGICQSSVENNELCPEDCSGE